MQTMRNPENFRGWLRWIHGAGMPVPFMATAENHNTPRAVHWAGGAAYALYAQTLGAFLPGVPYLHNGIELAEPVPVNTGFDFTDEETAALPPSVLPLFSAAAMDWTRKQTLVADLRRVHALRAQAPGALQRSLPRHHHPAGDLEPRHHRLHPPKARREGTASPSSATATCTTRSR